MAVNVNVSPGLPKLRKSAIWLVFGIVGLIAFLIWLKMGSLQEGNILALLVLLVLGAIYPPLGIGIGTVVAIWLFYTGGASKLFGFIGNIGSVKGPSTPTVYAPLGPTIPGYTYAPNGTNIYSAPGLPKF